MIRDQRSRIAPGVMTDEERLERYESCVQWALSSPSGTLVPVDGLLQMLMGRTEATQAALATSDLSLEEVAERYASAFPGKGRPRSRAAVRKWIREGLYGVKLEAYLDGTDYRVTEAAFIGFVNGIREQNRQPKKRKGAAPARPQPRPRQSDVADEIADYQAKYSGRGQVRKVS